MFPASIGGWNSNTQQSVVHLPRSWKRDEPTETPSKTPQPAAVGPGVRKAANSLVSSKRVDPTAELAREILGIDAV